MKDSGEVEKIEIFVSNRVVVDCSLACLLETVILVLFCFSSMLLHCDLLTMTVKCLPTRHLRRSKISNAGLRPVQTGCV